MGKALVLMVMVFAAGSAEARTTAKHGKAGHHQKHHHHAHKHHARGAKHP